MEAASYRQPDGEGAVNDDNITEWSQEHRDLYKVHYNL